MTPTPKLIKTAAPALAALLVLAGCASTDPGGTSPSAAPSSTAAPGVSLAVPETSTAGQRVQVVIESAGLDGTTATLYQFAGGFTDKPPTCRDEDMKQIEVTLTGGPQPVEVSNDTAGDIWFVLQAGELATGCAAAGSVTRALIAPEVQLRWDESAQIKVGEFSYSVGVPVDPPKQIKGWEVAINWYGPYDTVPAAETATCAESELGPTSTATAKRSSQSDEGWVPTTVDLAEPGVYRVGWSVAETPWSVAAASECDETVTAMVE